MRTIRPVCVLFLLSYFSACSSSDKKNPLLDEAARYHTEATKTQAVVEPQIERIDSLKTVYSAQKTATAQATITTLDSLKAAFEIWEENVIEVPGMPHDPNHQHGKGAHKHADAMLKDLPADQMRDLQREMLTNIKQIQSRLDAVTRVAR